MSWKPWIQATRQEAAMWREYDMAANWCAQKGLQGKPGDPLPSCLGGDVLKEINEHQEEFQDRVRQSAYALAQEKSNSQQELKNTVELAK